MRKLILAMSLLACACSTGPAYKPPATPTALAGPFVTSAPGTNPRADLPNDWWRLYQDPVLDALVARAFEANADLRVAAANLAKARAAADEARSGRLPGTTVSGGASYGGTVQTGSGSGSTAALGSNQFAGYAQAGVSWEVDLFGRIGSRVAAAEADTQAAAAARDAVRVLVAAETARAYLDACAHADAVAVARQSWEVSERHFELVETLEKAGAAGKLEVERAGAAAAAVRAAIPPLEAQRHAALFELSALLGSAPRDLPEGASNCTTLHEPATDIPVGDGATLLRRRPDLREAERRLAGDMARIGVASADLYPTISLGGVGNFFRSDEVRGSDSLSFSLGPLLSWSFPNISAARARVRQARAQGNASLARFDGLVLNALKEVEQALTRVAAGRNELDALEEARTRAEKSWRLAEQRYKAGSVGNLEVLLALGTLLDARASVADARHRLASARVDLFKALGGGWEEAPSSGQRRFGK